MHVLLELLLLLRGVCWTFVPVSSLTRRARACAAPGYWTDSEYSRLLGPCPNPDACLGGRFSQCARGHTSAYCSNCVQNFFLENLRCFECDSVVTVVLLSLLQV
jgi:hypothetical protein